MGPGRHLGIGHPQRRQCVDALHAAELLCTFEDVGSGSIRSPTGLHEQRAAFDARQKRHDFGHRVVLMQRRVADVAVARAGQQDDNILQPVRQPD
jgi:hypothetical protein